MNDRKIKNPLLFWSFFILFICFFIFCYPQMLRDGKNEMQKMIKEINEENESRPETDFLNLGTYNSFKTYELDSDKMEMNTPEYKVLIESHYENIFRDEGIILQLKTNNNTHCIKDLITDEKKCYLGRSIFTKKNN